MAEERSLLVQMDEYEAARKKHNVILQKYFLKTRLAKEKYSEIFTYFVSGRLLEEGHDKGPRQSEIRCPCH
jgi:hypothetical protein